MVKKNTCVFISGKGTNLRNLILKSRDYNFPINIRLVITNNPSSKGINYAKINSIPFKIIKSNSRIFEHLIMNELNKYKIDFICLAGYMRIIPKKFFTLFRKKIINIHPSLLPKYKGLNTFSRVLHNKEKKTGCTVHFVNSKLDSGNRIIQKFFYIKPGDNETNLKYKTQKMEYLAFPEAIIRLFR